MKKKQEKKNRTDNKKDILITALFIISTTIFLIQHAKAFSWDFSAYVLNARYFFSDSTFFEPLRPPLMPFILGILSIFGWQASEYLFIIFASYLFMRSATTLARTLKLDPASFYALTLTPYTLIYGLYNGTELLSLSFIALGTSSIIEDNEKKSGIYLALAALSRYTALASSAFLIFHKTPKKIIKSAALFALTLTPWLLWNHATFGNMLTSIADQYALNILYRGYINDPPHLEHFTYVAGILIPFIILGAMKDIKNIIDKIRIRTPKEARPNIIMAAFTAFALYVYISTPAKDPRFLFYTVLPISYYSLTFITAILKRRSPIRHASIALFIISSLILASQLSDLDYETHQDFDQAIAKLAELNRTDCALMSNAWVQLNYKGQETLIFPRQYLVESSLDEGITYLAFKNVHEPEYIFNTTYISTLPVIYEDNNFIIIAEDACAKKQPQNSTYLDQVKEYVYDKTGETINTNPCFILFQKTASLEKTCNLLNGNGVMIDSNRKIS